MTVTGWSESSGWGCAGKSQQRLVHEEVFFHHGRRAGVAIGNIG